MCLAFCLAMAPVQENVSWKPWTKTRWWFQSFLFSPRSLGKRSNLANAPENGSWEYDRFLLGHGQALSFRGDIFKLGWFNHHLEKTLPI